MRFTQKEKRYLKHLGNNSASVAKDRNILDKLTAPRFKHRLNRAEQNYQIQPSAEILEVKKIVRELEI